MKMKSKTKSKKGLNLVPAYVLVIISSHFVPVAKASTFTTNNFQHQSNMCVNIPSDLKLCHDVGYDRMVLPNLLNHESLDEVRHQAASFVPLLAKNCHNHLKEFLCSLFAPVCLPPDTAIPGPIPPCKSLCKSVERSCSPILRRHNFKWPPMLNCNKFSERDPCISFKSGNSAEKSRNRTNAKTQENTCAPCDTTLEQGSLHDNYCASEFVLKLRVRRCKIRRKRGIRQITADRKRRVIYKKGPLGQKDLRRLRLVLRGLKNCHCPALDDASTKRSRKRSKGKRGKPYFLVMGTKVGRKLFANVLHSWPKRNRVLRRASKNDFGASKCPGFGSVNAS